MPKINEAQQKIIEGYQKLCQEQQFYISQLTNVKANLRELYGVINVMKTLDPSRQALSMYSDTLIKSDISGQLNQKIQLFNCLAIDMKTLNENFTRVSEELRNYRKTHNIRMLTEEELQEHSRIVNQA